MPTTRHKAVWIIYKNQKALTLIELLVVIFVLWVGILSIVLLMSKNLSLIKTIHSQNSATILAREGIELAYHVRNTNNILWYERDCAVRWTNECKTHMLSGNTYPFFTIEWWTSDSQIMFSGVDTNNNFEDRFAASRLYLTGKTVVWTIITGYTHDITTSPSQFARYVVFSGMQDLPKSWPILSGDIHHISSIVLYKLSDQTTGSIILESFIANID